MNGRGLNRRAQVPARTYRSALVARLAALATAFLLLSTSIAWLPSGVGATGPKSSQAPSTDVELDPELSGLVDAIPYSFPPNGGGFGGSALDPSVQVRPDFSPASRPSEKTAVEDLWSADERVWANPDGTFTVDRGVSLNFLGSDGDWKAFDHSLVEGKDGAFRPASAPTDLTLPIAADDGTIATLKGADGSISIKTVGYASGAKVEERLEYSALGDGPAVFVRPTDTGFEFGATFAGAAAGSVATFVLDAGDLKAELSEDGRSILIRGAADQSESDVVGSISAPFVIDEAGAEATPDQVSVLLVGQPDGTYLLSYLIDQAWFGAKERVFPITLDPTACIRGLGGTSCDGIDAGGAFDIWYGDGQPTLWVNDSTTTYLHVGNYKATTAPWDFTRSALYFPGISLPDGAIVTDATLQMREAHNYSGAAVARIYARMINKPSGWTIDTSSTSWNSLNGAVRAGYDSPLYEPCDTGATDCDINLDVTKMVRAWYSRRGPDWQPNTGIQLRYATEGTGSNYWETSFYRYDASAGNRPLLTIDYEVPSFELDFDKLTLGETYAPSTMRLGSPTVLPITITNNASFTLSTASYRLGYRWFDTKGSIVSFDNDEALSGNIGSGSTVGPMPLSVTPPPTQGTYTLRLDLVRVVGGDKLFASDWAAPSKYYSRNKRLLTSDSTRWTGSSVIERAEFGIRVISGQGSAGTEQSVRTGDGGQLAVNLWTRNLSFDADSGLGFSDRLPVGLTYGYNSIDAETCAGYLGVLGACGWFTTYDERLTAGSEAGNFTYFDPSGNGWLVDTDGDGQLVGAPTQLYRVRATLFDENRPSPGGGSLTSVASLNIGAYAGTPNVVAVPSNTTTTLAGTSAGGDISLNTFRVLRWGMRTSGATQSALCAEIFNKTANTTKWFCYTTGGTWTTGQAQHGLGGSINGTWASYFDDLWGKVANNASFGDPEDDYYVKRLQIMAAPSSPASQTFIDVVRLTPKTTVHIADAVPSGMTGSPTAITTDKVTGTHALKATANSDCEASCFTATDITSSPFARWWWRKAGGETAAVRFRFKDVRTNQFGYITYYAGPVAPTDAPDCWHTPGLKCVIQVSPTVPGAWTRVTRNVLEDARQLLNFFYDSPTGSTTTTPPTQGPTPDRVQLVGYMVRPVDGNFLLVDQLTVSAAPEPADFDRYAVQDMGDSPTNSTDTRFAYDFKSERSDGRTHFFNRDGLLVRIADANGQATNLDWTYGGSSGQANYTLAAIRAPSDGSTSGSWTYNRQIDVSSTSADGFKKTTFTEALGTTGGGAIPGRRADFYVAIGAGASWGDKDLVKVSQARHDSDTCGAAPSGCIEFAYTSTTSHRLAFVADPRYDGSGVDERTQIAWDGNGDPQAILDRSHGSAVLLKVLEWNRGTSSLYTRPLFQDSAAAAANSAMHVQLSPDGSLLTEYARQACGASCTSYPPADETTLNAHKSVTYHFDGLAKVNSVTTYRCPGVAVDGCSGTTPLLSKTRQATNAGAKVDNFVDALAGSALAWTQSADQHFASLRDSNGTNEDLYRTEYATDGLQKPVVSRSPVLDRAASYPDAIKSSQWLTQYWRLGEASGTFASSAGGASASGATVTYGQSGALVRDPNAAVGFNGTSSRITSTATVPSTSYSIEMWVKPGASNLAGRSLIGDYTSNSGVLLYVNSNNVYALAHNSARASSTIIPTLGRWTHIVATWDGSRAKLYVDGNLAAWTSVTGAPGAGATSLEIGSSANGSAGSFLLGSIDEVSIRSQAINQSKIRKHFYSGRGVAPLVTETQYDLRGRPLQTASQIALNGDVEEGLNGFDTNFGAVHETSVVHGGTGAIKLPINTSIGQDFVLAPGQRFQIQLWTRTDGTSGTMSVYEVYYWRTSDQSWQTFSGSPLGVGNSTTWQVMAHQYTVPATDTPGLIRLAMWNGSTAGPVYFDDILLTTGWSTQTYLTGGILEGLPDATTSLSATGSGTVITKQLYGPTSAHPGIFGTSVIQNYLDGTQGPGPDQDVTATMAFDSWGRSVATADPDGVSTATTYAANKTDVASTADGLGNTTAYTHDAVGNLLSITTPLGRTTASTYDARNHVTMTVAADGTIEKTDYDDFGRATASWMNWVNGDTTDGDGTDDILTTFGYDAYGRVTRQDAECGSVAACATNGLDARALTSYDLLGNVVAATVYSGSNGAGPRVTTNHFETYGSSPRYSRLEASGVQLPIAPGTSAPWCPGSTTIRCSTAAAWTLNSVAASAIDMNGQAFAMTDAYGIVTVSDRDLGGRVVASTAGFIAGATPDSDTNVVRRTEYNLLGDVITATDPIVRRDRMTYDALGRQKTVSHRTTADSQYLLESFEYLPSGRLSRAFDGSAWTETIYDRAGRAVSTLVNDDQGGGAGMTIDAFEGAATQVDDDANRPWGWRSDATTLVTTGATLFADSGGDGNAYDTIAPVSGRGRLRVTTHATSANTGVWRDLSGPLFKAGHVYKASFDLRASAASLPLTAYLGQDSSGGSVGSLAITSLTTWARYTVTWTPGANINQDVHFILRQDAAGTADIYLDNLVVWDSSAPETGIASSVSAYNADGEVTASILPPGDPATERPLVTTVAFDAAGRTVASVTNGTSGAYAAIIAATGSLAAYFPLDERFGSSTADKTGGGALAVPATTTLGLAGGIDEARTAARVTGASNSYLSRSTNATGSTTNVSMEAWIRSDTTPAGTVVVASNGTSSNSWGLAIDSAGNASGFTQNSGGAGFTTMASTKIVTDGAWHHLVLTRGASTWALSVDGVAQTLSNNAANPGTPGAGFTIGAWSDGTRASSGEIDEVAVYTTELLSGVTSAHWAAGRETDEVTALTTRNAYDRLGRLTDAWAPDLVRTKAGYDRLGNQLETIVNYRDGSTTGGTADDDVRSTFAYSVLGELIGYCPAVQVKSVGGCSPSTGSEPKAWHYEFDALGRQVKTIAPDNTSVTDLTIEEVVYEPGGRVAKTCRYPALVLPAVGACGDPNSRHTDFAYDKLGRITEQETWDRVGGSDTLKFTKTLTWNEDGSPATVNEGSDTLTNVYDTAGRLSQLKRGATVLTAYTYTPGTSTIATRTDGTQGATAFTYDWARRQTVIDPPDTFVSGNVTRTYRLDGLLASQSFPSSLSETLAYDAVKRPLSISLGSAGSISQTFDRAGNITSDARSLTGISGDAGSGTQAFSYDDLSRLTGSTGLTDARSYQYDLDGNRTRRAEGSVTTDFTYDRADQLATQTIGVTTRTYDYDRYGNLLQGADPASALTTYAYDEASRLVTINPPGGGATQITFTLDALDRHATRSEGSGPPTLTDTYAYLDATETAWQTGQGATTTTTSLLDADGTRLAVKTNGNVSWLVFDLHGSVVALCPSSSSTLSDAYRFDGWGQQIAAWSSAGPATNPWRYRGLLNVGSDALTGALLDMVSRHYSPQLGVFTQQDSVQGSAANPMTMNRFLYALANPATLIDPDGRMAIVDGLSGDGVLNGEVYKAGRTIADGGTVRDPLAEVATWVTRQAVGTARGAVIGVAKGVEGVGRFAVGAANFSYRSTAAWMFDRDAFDEQWDENILVGGYIKDHPMESVGALASGFFEPLSRNAARGEIGQGVGEMVGGAFVLGGFGKIAAMAREAAGLARVGAATTQISRDLAGLTPGEGIVGTYGGILLARAKGSGLQANHVPAGSWMGAKVPGWTRSSGVAINMTAARHRLTATYGRQPNLALSGRQALARDIFDIRSIYMAQGMYGSTIRSGLQQVISMNQRLYPHLFGKVE